MTMKPMKYSALAVLSAAALVAGCGGGSDKKTGGSGEPTSTDPIALLKSVNTKVDNQQPVKVDLNMTLSASEKPTNPQLATFLDKPITIKLSGPSDTKNKKTDLTFSVVAGPVNVSGEIRQVGEDGFVAVNNKWYKLDPGTLSGKSTTDASSKLDTQKLLDAVGDPAKLIKNAKVDGVEDIGGIKSDHVSGDIDIAELLAAAGRVADASGQSSNTSVEQLKTASEQLKKYIDNAKMDVWIGQSDHQLHRAKLDTAIKLDDATAKQAGLKGAALTIDIQSVPTTTPTVTAPTDTSPISDLTSNLGSLLSGLGGSTP